MKNRDQIKRLAQLIKDNDLLLIAAKKRLTEIEKQLKLK